MSKNSGGVNNAHKGRSPLASVFHNVQQTNCNHHATQNASMVAGGAVVFPGGPNCCGNVNTAAEANLRKYMSICSDERFFLYRRRITKQQPPFYGEDHFGKLSDEMILQIFRWLPKKALMRCSQVSKRFNRVSQDETLWTRLDLSGRSLREGALGRVISRGTVILRLAQAHVLDPIFPQGSIEPTFTSKLQFLDLSMCSIDSATLAELLSRCRALRKLSLENVPLGHRAAECCEQIAANENLEALNLTMCEGMDCNSVASLFKNLSKLHSLNISWAQLSRDAVDSLVNNVTPSLLRLNIAGCRQSMTDTALEKLIERCPKLLELDLSDCTQLTSNAIKIICRLQKLEYLSLSRCYNIAVTSYLHLTELKSLLFLDVFGLLSDQAINMLQTSFPNVGINKFMHSSVARPTVGTRRTSIWGLRTRD